MIYFLEDDAIHADLWSVDLQEAGFVVKVFSRVGQFLKAMEEASPLPDAIMLDILLATDGVFDRKEAQNGVRTGLLVADKIMEICLSRQLPPPPILAVTQLEEHEKALKDRKIDVLLKQRATGSQILEWVRSMGIKPESEKSSGGQS